MMEQLQSTTDIKTTSRRTTSSTSKEEVSVSLLSMEWTVTIGAENTLFFAQHTLILKCQFQVVNLAALTLMSILFFMTLKKVLSFLRTIIFLNDIVSLGALLQQ